MGAVELRDVLVLHAVLPPSNQPVLAGKWRAHHGCLGLCSSRKGNGAVCFSSLSAWSWAVDDSEVSEMFCPAEK